MFSLTNKSRNDRSYYLDSYENDSISDFVKKQNGTVYNNFFFFLI